MRRQQKAGGESGQVRMSLPEWGWGRGQRRAGAGAACSEGRWQGGRARRCGAASGTRPRVWRLAGPLGPESGSRGWPGVRRGDCVGLGSASMALCASFLAQGWGQRRPHASRGPCSAGGVAVLPVPLPPDCSLCLPSYTPALVPHQSLPHGAGQPACGGPVLAATLCCPLQYGGREWSCWDRLEVRAVGADGQEMTVQEVLDWLQVSPALAAPSRVTLGAAGLDVTPASCRGRMAGL